jgi:hypothetical protein
MKLTRSSIASVAVLCTLGLVGGGAALVSPASASAGVNWGHIFKKEIKPRADKRYYTKKKANARFAVKSALLGYYTKAESDAKYATPGSVAAALGGYYTKAQSDAKYAPFPAAIRGTYSAIGYAAVAGAGFSDNITFGVTLSAAPAVHYINQGAAVPAGCLGTAAAPDAAPGNLCVFEALNNNGTTREIFNGTGSVGSASTFGAGIFATATAAGQMYVYGTWAVRPLALAANRVPTSSAHAGPGLGR